MGKTLTIAITRYAESDDLLARSLAAATAQIGVEGEVLLVDQKTSAPFDPALVEPSNLPLRIIIDACGSLSAARNIALDEARGDCVLYLDADAIAQPDWAGHMLAALQHRNVAIAGSRIVPGWEYAPPFFTRANVVRDQYSMLDLGADNGPATKVVGASFGVDKTKLPGDVRFDPELGRRDGRLFGGEETAFFAQAKALGFDATYVGKTFVTHLVASERMQLGWIIKRIFYAGYGRAAQGGAPAPSKRLNIYDWLVAPVMFPAYVAGWAWAQISRTGTNTAAPASSIVGHSRASS